MGWWALIRIALVFGLLYVAVPFWVHHRSHRRSGWTADAAESFGWLCFVLQVSISVLGKIHLALPGAVTTIYSAWVLANLLRHRAHVAFEGRTWVTSAARLLTLAEHFRIQA